MPAKPRVSVIITTYNRAALLVESIESVFAQTYRDYELIVVDNGSTDETGARIKVYEERVRYLPLEYSGQLGDARNTGILAARGELIAFLDDDDLWRADKLARQVALYDSDAGLGLTYSDAQLLLPDGSLSPAVLPAAQKQPHGVFTQLLADCFVHPSTVMVPKNLFQTIGLFDQRFFHQADYYFWILATRMRPVSCLPEPLVQIRRHAQSVSETDNLRHYQCAVEMLTDVQATIPLTIKERLIVRRTLARWHTHIGLALTWSERERARSHFRQSVRLNPCQWRAWRALLRWPREAQR